MSHDKNGNILFRQIYLHIQQFEIQYEIKRIILTRTQF